MNTRIEQMNNKVYCAYCGKELQDKRFSLYPNQPLICTCEKATRELELYDELKDLYNVPLANSIIDMKVEAYRNKLLGKQVPASPNITCGTFCDSANSHTTLTNNLSTPLSEFGTTILS